MDFNSIAARHPRDMQLPARAFRLSMLQAVLAGTFYDSIPNAFHEEKNGAGEYVKVHDRRPNVTYKFLRQVVEDSVSFLFGEARFPAIDCPDETTRDQFRDIVADSRLVPVMREAALMGAVGSVCVWMRVLNRRLFFKALSTTYLTPEFDPGAPDTLIKVTERYKVKGHDLLDLGYDIGDDDLETMFWFHRIFDVDGEWWHVPYKVSDAKVQGRKFRPMIDSQRSTQHRLGFCPMVWIKNLPGGDDIDGTATIAPALDLQIAIDYQLSQAGRALKYSADPVLLLKEPAQSEGEIVRSASNAIVVDQNGDGKLLEINGNAAAAVIDYVKWLREAALESLHANRASADRMSAAQSGAALKLHYAPMVQLADALRASYGDALLTLADMIRRASDRCPLLVYGKALPSINAIERLHLRWPDFFVATPHDQSMQAATLSQLRQAGLLSRETGVKELAAEYDINDVSHEITQIKADEAESDARETTLAGAQAQVKVTGEIE